jgi:hypothetical protein
MTAQAPERDQLVKNWSFIMGDERGRQIVKRILLACGTHVTVLPKASEPGNQIYVNAGCQKLGQDLQREILDVVPELWFGFYRNEIKDLMSSKKEKS